MWVIKNEFGDYFMGADWSPRRKDAKKFSSREDVLEEFYKWTRKNGGPLLIIVKLRTKRIDISLTKKQLKCLIDIVNEELCNVLLDGEFDNG